MNKNIFLFFICFLFFLTSCKTKEKASELNYMQNVEQIATETALNNTVSTIQKGDQLMIFVSAKNMDVVKPFNQTYFGSQNALSNTASAGNAGSEKVYLVNEQGNIDFPILGTLSTNGKTLESFKKELTEDITKYVKEPVVTVRLANFKVTILGEVNRPGQYMIPETQTTLLNAIGLAGDLTLYGKRDNVLLVRNENGQMTKERINLMDSNFTNSPYFTLKQGDVIYVSSNETKEKISRQDPNTGVYIAIAGTLIGLAGIFITIFKK